MTVLVSDPIHEKRQSAGVALRTRSETWSYEILNGRVEDWACRVRDAGFGIGNRIGILARRSPETIAAIFGVLRAGAAVVLFDPKYPPDRLRLLHGVAQVDAGLEALPEAGPVKHLVPVRQVDRDATVLFTSGSSGMPKAVVHSLANHLHSANGSFEQLPLSENDTWLLSLPIHHVGGLAILFRCFQTGASVAIAEPRESLSRAIRHFGVTHLSCVPTQLQRLLDDTDPIALRAVLLGGSRLAPELILAARDAGLPVFVTYGCTEMASQVCTGEGVDTVGRPLPHREVSLASDGEILVKGKTLFRGYLSDAGIDPARDQDGWFHTGDLGEWRGGELAVLGRKDSMFISGGENVQPEEIERELIALPGVVDAVVVSRPDAEYGRRPVAFLAGDWAEDDLRRQLRTRLPSFMIPDAFLPLPETTGLKPQRAELQARVDGSTGD